MKTSIRRSCICARPEGRRKPHRVVVFSDADGYTVIACPCPKDRHFTVRLTKREKLEIEYDRLIIR